MTAGFVLRRLASGIAIIASVSLLVFVVLRVIPGDPVTSRMGTASGVNEATVNSVRASLGLNRPILVQYWSWLTDALSGDFGRSFSGSTPVSSMISNALPATLQLTFFAVMLATLASVPLAVWCALRPRSWVDRLIVASTTAGMAFPPFLIGIVLILIFSLELGWLPARGYVSMSDGLIENLRHLVLPTVTLAVVAAPLMIRLLRASLIEAIEAPYMRTARGKGLVYRDAVIRHALQNAAVPSLTMLGLIVGYSLGGAVVIEYVFGFSGLGSLAVTAISTRDYPVIQAVTLLISAMFVLTSTLIEIVIGAVDPRQGGTS